MAVVAAVKGARLRKTGSQSVTYRKGCITTADDGPGGGRQIDPPAHGDILLVPREPPARNSLEKHTNCKRMSDKCDCGD